MAYIYKVRAAMWVSLRKLTDLVPDGSPLSDWGNRIGHNYVGHNYIGHNYVGHNYIGHNYIVCNPSATGATGSAITM